MATIAGLVVEISANAQKFHRAVEGIKGKAQKFANQLKTIIGAATKAVVAGATAAAAAVTTVVSSTALAMRDLVRDSKAVGVAAQDLQAWQYAAESMGIEGDKVQDIFKDMSDKIGDFARTGGGEAADVFEQLGLSAANFINLSPDQALLRIGEALEGLSQNEKIFFMESIADDASRLLPLLDDNASAFNKLREQGKAWGLVMTDADIKASAALGNTLKKAGDMAKGFKNLLGANLAPTFNRLLEWIKDLTAGFGGPRQAAESMADAIKTAIAGAASAVETMVGYLKNVYGFLLKIQELQFQVEAGAATVNRIATGNAGPDSEVPEAFNKLLENRRKQASLESGDSGFDGVGAAFGDLSERVARPVGELSETAVRSATNIGILANASRDTAEAMVKARNDLMQTSSASGAASGGLVPTGDQSIAPSRASRDQTSYSGLNLSSITPMSQDEVRAMQAARPAGYGSSAQAAANSTAGGLTASGRNLGTLTLTVANDDGETTAEGEISESLVSLLASAAAGT